MRRPRPDYCRFGATHDRFHHRIEIQRGQHRAAAGVADSLPNAWATRKKTSVRMAPFTHELLSQYGASREIVTHYRTSSGAKDIEVLAQE